MKRKRQQNDVKEGKEEKQRKRKKYTTDRCWVYVLESASSPHYSYVGFTTDRATRLRKHNGELVGGAKYTRGHRPWKMVMSITSTDLSWWNQPTALKLEWRIKHVRRRSGKSSRSVAAGRRPSAWSKVNLVGRPAVERRINDILWLLTNRKKWTKSEKCPTWDPDTMKEGLHLEFEPSLLTLAVKNRIEACPFWKLTTSSTLSI